MKYINVFTCIVGIEQYPPHICSNKNYLVCFFFAFSIAQLQWYQGTSSFKNSINLSTISISNRINIHSNGHKLWYYMWNLNYCLCINVLNKKIYYKNDTNVNVLRVSINLRYCH